jgi:nitrogen-specific signal transduction histidine kinase
VSALPVGVLISDQSGFISFANERARSLLASTAETLVGSSFFSLFSNPNGDLIDKYSSLSEVSGQTLGPLVLGLRNDSHIIFSATMISIQSQSQRLVATLISNNTSSTPANPV